VNPRRLYRSRDRQLAGVAGGMAEYLDIDPTIVRILWILAAVVTGGLILLVYLVLALVVPPSPYAAPAYGAQGYGGPSYAGQGYPGTATAPGTSAGWSTGQAGTPGWTAPGAGSTGAPAWSPDWNATTAPQAPRRAETRGVGAAAIVGVVLIVFGALALADAVLPAWSAAALMGPALLLALGAALLVASVRRPVADPAPAGSAAPAPAGSAAPAPAGEAAHPAAGAPTAQAWATTEAPDEAPTAATPWETTDTQPVDQHIIGTEDASSGPAFPSA
jgi:phage shock protein C